ncbi:MAG TPA: hypothetical protein VFI02_10745 [Armatimonadota bacterium]|nr:hypothetical protein [Armatimonadota bacterium]
MKVLVLEDQGTASNYLIKYISEKAGHEPVLARSIKDGESILEESLGEEYLKIDCIIADINMPADGLKPEEKKISELGKFAGWLWLSRHVFVREEFEYLSLRTIIYSIYVDDLRNSELGVELKGILQVHKQPARGGIRKLHRCLDEIAKQVARSKSYAPKEG